MISYNDRLTFLRTQLSKRVYLWQPFQHIQKLCTITQNIGLSACSPAPFFTDDQSRKWTSLAGTAAT